MSGLVARVAADGRLRSRPVPDPSVYENALGQIALRLAPTTEGDPIGIHASLLSMVSAVIGPRVSVAISDGRHPLLIWTLMVGATSSGRKGTATDSAKRLMAAVAPDFFGSNVISGLSSAEGLIMAVKDADQDEEDSALSSGADRSVADKRRLVLEAEYSVVLTRSRREGNALTQFCGALGGW